MLAHWNHLKFVLLLCSAFLLAAPPAQAATQKLSAGRSHSLWLKQDGSVWAWGSNTYGQIGGGNGMARHAPTRVPGLTNIVDIAAGANHSLAVAADGRLFAWGRNDYGQMGDGTSNDRSRPTVVVGIGNVTAVAATIDSSYALKSDGTVWRIGSRACSTPCALRQAQVQGIANAIAIAAGSLHILALRSDGTVFASGENWYGQLGDGTRTSHLRDAVQVSGLTNIVAVAAGHDSSMALSSTGAAYSWGANFAGQLGNGATTWQTSPVTVTGLTDAIAITLGGDFAMALTSNGSLLTWGSNYEGQLGDESIPSGRSTPAPVPNFTGGVAIGAGAHALALKANGQLVGWGTNRDGQLGDGTGPTLPAPVPGLSNITKVATGSGQSFAIRADGTVFSWGSNYSGELGYSTSDNWRDTPTAISGLSNVASLAAGSGFSLALHNDSTVSAWGGGFFLGDGSTSGFRATPGLVPGLTNITAVTAGYLHAIALKNDGTLRVWGSNLNGQLGDGTTTDSSTPIAVSGLSGITAIAGGLGHTLAVRADGTAVAWGGEPYYYDPTPVPTGSKKPIARLSIPWSYYNLGQLGDGTTQARLTPVPVSTLHSAVAVAAGFEHSLALLNDGTVMAWGSMAPTPSLVPIALPGLTDVTAIAAGGSSNLALRTGGTVAAWQESNAPTTVSGLQRIVAIANGWDHFLAVRDDGILFSWGDNANHVLGYPTYRLTPTNTDDQFPPVGSVPSTWTATAGSAQPWKIEIDSTAAGPFALRSGTAGDGAQSGIGVTANLRAGVVRFQRRVSSESGADYLRFYIDGVKQDEWAGELPWGAASYPVTAGVHQLAWQYEKNASGSAGSDAAWIDSVEMQTAFADTAPTGWAFNYINALKDAGITTGCGGGNYCPAQYVTRQQMAALIIRAADGEPVAGYCGTTNPFADVFYTSSMCSYIKRMAELNITTGCGSGNFCPNAQVTREQMAVFIVRALEGDPAANYCGGTAPFGDITADSWACGQIKRLAELNVTTGCGGGNFCPAQIVTREQMAAFIARAFLGM